MLMNSFKEWLTDANALNFISSRDPCWMFSSSQTFDKPKARFESAQNLITNFNLYTTAPQEIFFQKKKVKGKRLNLLMLTFESQNCA